MKRMIAALPLLLTLAACGGPASQVEGKWNVDMNGVTVGSMTIHSGSISASDGVAGKVEKWTEHGKHITAWLKSGQGLVFDVISKNHLQTGQGLATVDLIRVKS